MRLREVKIVPDGWPCVLAACPPGLFMFQRSVCVKTEYRDDDGNCIVYDAESGEAFWGGTDQPRERDALEVQPVRVERAYD